MLTCPEIDQHGGKEAFFGGHKPTMKRFNKPNAISETLSLDLDHAEKDWRKQFARRFALGRLRMELKFGCATGRQSIGNRRKDGGEIGVVQRLGKVNEKQFL